MGQVVTCAQNARARAEIPAMVEGGSATKIGPRADLVIELWQGVVLLVEAVRTRRVIGRAAVVRVWRSGSLAGDEEQQDWDEAEKTAHGIIRGCGP
ncbi:MAG: hypothetical protein ACI8W8_003206 [Rhodothermales bacterium]|jgi:hypothetical protein